MQLKGLVRFFAIALILICLYQLSFTWFVHNHENKMRAQTTAWMKANYPQTPQQKYPNDKYLQALYADTLKDIESEHLKRLLDSTKNTSIGPFGFTTYQNAKEKELLLGLDLQGGMSVTMEVGMDGLIHSLANNTKDTAFNKALASAVTLKANSNGDLIKLFVDEYAKRTNNAPLAPFFVIKSNEKIKYNSSNDAVLNYLHEQGNTAFNNTFRILNTRIDRFGVSSPNINPDPVKGIINIELAGVNDEERVRHYLQSTANLQFFEMYNISEIGEGLLAADKAVAGQLKTGKNKDSLTASKITDTSATSKVDHLADTTKTATLSGMDANAAQNNSTDTTKNIKTDAPIRSLFVAFAQGQQTPNGGVQYPAYIGYVLIRDTSVLNDYLKMDIVKSKFPANLAFVYGKVGSEDPKMKDVLPLYAIKTLDNGAAPLEGEHVTDARQDYDEKGKVAIKMNMDATGTRIWANMTKNNIGKPIAIVMDNLVYSAPFVNSEIPNGSSEISGSYSVIEAQDLADILQSGKLPAPAKIVAEQVVGPTLGEEAVNGGMMSFAISFIVIFILMLVYYNTGGWVANVALILNLLFTIGILAALGFTLTAPGIAGLVLTIGMAVDTNVIIFERIKEELTRGKGYLTAVSDGYKRSYAPVLDAHVTTFLTAAILFYFGLGPVLGFATTQMLGITLSLFCGILISRLITDFYTNKKRHFNYFTKISTRIFKHANFKFIEYRKVAYAISVVVLIMGIASYFHGFDKGVEFNGGRSYTIKFPTPPNIENVRNDLKEVFGEFPTIKTVGSDDQLNITTAYMITENAPNLDSLVQAKLFNGLKKYLPEGATATDFDKKFKQSSQKVLPTISADLKSGATKATIFSIIIICLYIFIRFRDWRYSFGTIVSLLHDVFVTLIVFSFARSFVNFPLEIDQYFIAAILTVIGFSMNDTIIVYDRIREDSHLLKNTDKGTIINTAINQTLSRTIMTSVTVFLTLLILFLFGGEVTKGFAFAMLIGVVTGTYSSIFVAAPILIDFGKNRPLGKREEKK